MCNDVKERVEHPSEEGWTGTVAEVRKEKRLGDYTMNEAIREIQNLRQSNQVLRESYDECQITICSVRSENARLTAELHRLQHQLRRN